ncbi:MAG: bifunctional hydroxymethylpyrimidine kinase/phosphomethylpyrimidine kinase [Melioribacteraceae bacterium]|nr:bifunctional hydroxymethylpyrimidine kinase/phosphomethylpyrimidine kinase [Melioribacteraceae bacterium]MCF8265462.1 bifunctional hydroxymethylpyrimidine kinase/phosphomethylpyrimidine kinase [Melioribacteraceae bacterium]MCF8413023.1 bifunctional hydroxymethylpyrimidine kinase/phosphomethylpyrimidine kinase [Melioribacteraceae bacterium]MCF8432256.1 bifunctional hydroxymethylpyrimidine kinase/phosphomethylpyrimidine kinase [Melioribacteraceae bacterium]
MALLTVGSIALDSIETPFDKTDNALGGSATYIALAASYFTAPVEVVGVVGEDFATEHIEMLEKHNIGLDGMQVIKNGKTFRWGGKYHFDLNTRDTLFTELGVFENFNPIIPEKHQKSDFLILGNIGPDLQLKVLEQMEKPKFTVCDTMNLWIDLMKDKLIEVLKQVDVLIINDSETRQLTSEPNLIKSAQMIQKMGPKYLIIKKGEHGALLFGENQIFSAPAYPMTDIYDPTGAGDSFAGGFTGYLHRERDLSFESLKRAVIYGSTMASFCVEKFSTKGLEDLSTLEVKARYNEFKELSRFE